MPEDTQLLDRLFSWLTAAPWWAFPVVLAVSILFATPLILRKVSESRQSLRNLRDPEATERARLRRVFARMILARHSSGATFEVSSNFGFTELEAEVEAEGVTLTGSRLFRAKRLREGQLRREPSLTAALERSREPFIVLEGDPGSGKTVALRKVERSFAEQIEKSPDCALPFPLYVNLKSVPSGDGDPSEKLRLCILKSLEEDCDVASERFEQGCRNGGWLLLLDGFDEIPDVLSATEANEQIGRYARAIRDFCDRLNVDLKHSCQTVIASRPYHGPLYFKVRFRILPLSNERRNQFIANYGIDGSRARRLIESLVVAPNEIQAWAHNPLTLAMLCDIVRRGHDLPSSVYALFEIYLEERFSRDAGRIQEIYGGNVTSLRRAAEDIAFVMAAVPGLISLDPSTSALKAALQRSNRPIEDLDAVLHTINVLKLALSEYRAGEVHTCFRHRRLQEYFATCVILREPDLLSPEQLLFDANWREACVVLFQRAPLEQLSKLLACSAKFLRSCSVQLGIERILDIVAQPADAMRMVQESLGEAVVPVRYAWPPKLHHVLSLFQTGFAYRDDLSEEVQQYCVSIVLHIYKHGVRLDKKHALELVGTFPRGFMEGTVLSALNSDSELLQDVAFRQLPRAGSLSVDTQLRVNRLLYRMAHSGHLEQERLAVGARISRLNSPVLAWLFEMLDASYAIDRCIRLVLLALLFTGTALVVIRKDLSLLQSGALLLATTMVPTLSLILRRRVLAQSSLDMLAILPAFTLALAVFKTEGAQYAGATVAVTSAAFIYGYFWQPCVFFAVRLNEPMRRWSWPFLPLVLFLRLIRQQPLIVPVLLPFVGIFYVLFNYESELRVVMEPIVPYLFSPLIPVLLFICYLLLRRAVLHVLDIYRKRSWSATLSRMTPADLRDLMADLRTSGVRIRFLREVVRGGRFSLFSPDDEMRQDLGEFLRVIEVHALEIQKKPGWSLKEVLTSRVALSDEYRAGCLSEHQRWCLQHLAAMESVEDLAVVIDLLTEIAERASLDPEARTA